MTIIEKRYQNANGAIRFIEDLAGSSQHSYVFRGQGNSKYKLENTWQRHRTIPHETWMTDIDEAFEKFAVGLAKIGIDKHNYMDRFEALEHARHHGVPTPCLDFSYSPYVALFFAFNGVRIKYTKTDYVVIYALDLRKLAHEWAKTIADPKEDIDTFYKSYHEFTWPPEGLFENGFPAGVLQFIPFPGKSNSRMQNQLGALLYDTINYSYRKEDNIEDLIENIVEPKTFSEEKEIDTGPTMYKIFINKKAARSVFERLELMNINGGSLYGDADGVALDVKNTYNYNPKFSYLRDVKTPLPDETKI